MITLFKRRRGRQVPFDLWPSSTNMHVVDPTRVIPDPLFLLAVAKASPSVCGCVAELRAEAERLRRVVDAQLAQGLSVWPHEVEAYDGLERAARHLEDSKGCH